MKDPRSPASSKDWVIEVSREIQPKMDRQAIWFSPRLSTTLTNSITIITVITIIKVNPRNNRQSIIAIFSVRFGRVPLTQIMKSMAVARSQLSFYVSSTMQQIISRHRESTTGKHKTRLECQYRPIIKIHSSSRIKMQFSPIYASQDHRPKKRRKIVSNGLWQVQRSCWMKASLLVTPQKTTIIKILRQNCPNSVSTTLNRSIKFNRIFFRRLQLLAITKITVRICCCWRLQTSLDRDSSSTKSSWGSIYNKITNLRNCINLSPEANSLLNKTHLQIRRALPISQCLRFSRGRSKWAAIFWQCQRRVRWRIHWFKISNRQLMGLIVNYLNWASKVISLCDRIKALQLSSLSTKQIEKFKYSVMKTNSQNHHCLRPLSSS